jgi:tetratricopeptide (TPR) repeat protein
MIEGIRMNLVKTHTLAVLLVVALLLVGCGGDGGTGPPPPPPPTLVQLGWAAFEQADYVTAADKFQQAITKNPSNAEAHNGFGWASMKLGNLQNALDGFAGALSNGHNGADPHVGRAIVLRDLTPVDYNAAIQAANSALAIDPDYKFHHDPELDWQDVRLILAQSHFALGQYVEANDQVGLLGGNAQDPLSPTFVADLLAELERLGDLIGS